MRCAIAIVAAIAAIALAACGTPSADLFVVSRSGAVPGARLKLQFDDGGQVRCNGGAKRMISSQRLIDARELARDLEDDRSKHVPLVTGTAAILSYSVRLPDGTLRFNDTDRGLTKAMLGLAGLVRGVAKGVCGLQR